MRPEIANAIAVSMKDEADHIDFAPTRAKSRARDLDVHDDVTVEGDTDPDLTWGPHRFPIKTRRWIPARTEETSTNRVVQLLPE